MTRQFLPFGYVCAPFALALFVGVSFDGTLCLCNDNQPPAKSQEQDTVSEAVLFQLLQDSIDTLNRDTSVESYFRQHGMPMWRQALTILIYVRYGLENGSERMKEKSPVLWESATEFIAAVRGLEFADARRRVVALTNYEKLRPEGFTHNAQQSLERLMELRELMIIMNETSHELETHRRHSGTPKTTKEKTQAAALRASKLAVLAATLARWKPRQGPAEKDPITPKVWAEICGRLRLAGMDMAKAAANDEQANFQTAFDRSSANCKKCHDLYVLSPTTQDFVDVLRGHTRPVTSLVFSSDGKLLVSASDDQTIGVWDLANARRGATLRGHTGFVTTVAIHPNGHLLASGSDDRTVKLWNTKSAAELKTLRGHSGWVNRVQFAPDGQVLASGGEDGAIILWDPATGQLLHGCRGHNGAILDLVFTPDGKSLLSIGADQTLRKWDVAGGREAAKITLPIPDGAHIAFRADGTQFAISKDQKIAVWDANTGKEVRRLPRHPMRIEGVAFGLDGALLAVGGADAKLRLWRTSDGTEATLPRAVADTTFPREIRRAIHSVVFDAEGKRLALGGANGIIEVWRVPLD